MDKPRRVLIVDDDETIRGFLTELLTDEGYQTRVATNGAEGWASCRRGGRTRSCWT